MMRRHIFFSFALFTILLFTGAAPLPEKEREPALSVTGLVEKPQILSMRDLSQFNAVGVKITEVLSDRTYSGSFQYRGVPLRTLLELAVIRKPDPEYSKLIDLVILVKNAAGEKAVLTWGEVFYRNPSDTVIALSADPVRAMKSFRRIGRARVQHRFAGQVRILRGRQADPVRPAFKYAKLLPENEIETL